MKFHNFSRVTYSLYTYMLDKVDIIRKNNINNIYFRVRGKMSSDQSHMVGSLKHAHLIHIKSPFDNAFSALTS